MPGEEKKQNNLDEAYQRFGKRLKEKAKEQAPTKDPNLRARIKEINAQKTGKAVIFSEEEPRLQQLIEEFEIEIQRPETLEEHIVYLLAQNRGDSSKESTWSAADLYSQIHELRQYSGLSSKEFQKTLKRMEKNNVVQLQEIQGTLIIQIRSEFLSEDEASILDVATRKGGKVSLEQIMVSTQFAHARVQIALEALMAKKMVIQKKSFTKGTRYQISEQL